MFALLTAVPLAFLQGVLAWPHRIRFTHTFHFYRTVPSTNQELVWDILQAGGLGCLVTLGTHALLTVSFVHLSHAYGHRRTGSESTPARAALRAALYRAWLASMLAGQGLLAKALPWAVPESIQAAVRGLVPPLTLVPALLLFLSLRGAARHSCGCGPFASFTVVTVPFILMGLLTFLLTGEPDGTGLLDPWLPDPPAEAR